MAGDDRTRTVIPPHGSDAERTAPRGPLFDQDPTFAPGEMVADRYLIDRFIAFGGMGEVYEAEDTALKSRVALKTLRPDVADDARILERFKREILLARRVTHVNVCRLFDLGVHNGAKQVTFLTMELLDGDTLAQRIRAQGPLSTAAAAPIVRQMIAALDAAHAEGIIHRDFKSGNVILAGERVVVTDFGLARGTGGDPFATNVTADALAMMGSPAYMAPEQVEGNPTTVASDVYSLGVVMYEMVTGRVPFDGDSSAAVAIKRLKEPAPSPRQHVKGLDERWERTILRCLEREPARRFAGVADVAAALETAPRRRVPWLALGFGLAAVAFGTWGVWHLRSQHGTTRAARSTRPALAVLGFKNVSGRGDLAWVSTALGEMMTTELGAGGELRPIAGESVARMKRDLKLEDADSFAEDTLAKIHKHVGAEYVLLGSYVPLGDDKVRVDVRLQSAGGETLAHVADAAEVKDLAGLVARVGARLRESLRVGEAPEGELALVNAAMPRNPEAARLYAEGLARARLLDMRAARELLDKAIALEPSFPQAHLALAEALDYIGYEGRAEAEYKKALELGGNLPREERLKIEGSYFTAARSFARAAQAWQELYALAPDNVDNGLRLASSQFSAGDFDAGRRTIERVRRLPGAADDPFVHLVMVQAAMGRQDYRGARDEAERLAQTGEAHGAWSLVGEARHAQAVALWFEGDLDAALARVDEARQMAFTVGDRDGVAAAMTTRGFIEGEAGDHAASRKDAEEALTVAAEVGSRRRIPPALHVLARAAWFRGDLDEARRRFEQSAQAARDMGSVYWEALGQLGVAIVLALQGELLQAEPIYEKILVGFKLYAPKHNTGYLLHYLGELRADRGDPAGARKALGEALALREAIGERLQAERTRLALARVDLAEGKAAEAEAAAQRAFDQGAARNLRDDQVFAAGVLVRARLAQGNAGGAAEALAAAERAAAGVDSVWVEMEVRRVRGEVLLASGKLAEAERVLAEGAAAAEKGGFAPQALSMRLLLAEAGLRAGRKALARERLAAVAKDADRMGYALMSKRAAELLAR